MCFKEETKMRINVTGVFVIALPGPTLSELLQAGVPISVASTNIPAAGPSAD
jgi:hypothetical protein